MPITPQEVLSVVQRYGPIIPNSIKQKLEGGDTTMINVYLSQLKEEGKINFTHMQLGTSMFSYTKEQLPKLEELIKHLNEKDRRTANLLKEKKVLRTSQQDPLVRVSLQEIKDFAKPIKVKTNQGEEIFYRYFLVPIEEAQQLIRNQIVPKKESAIQDSNQEPSKKIETQPPKETPKQEAQQPSPKQEERKEVPEKDEPKPLPKTDKQTSLSTPEDIESEFGKQIEAYCQKNDITIKHYEEIRKDSDIELILEVPTALGKITFFAKAKSKKNSNDGDLAAAILRAKTHNLPALYLTTGSVTNKALEQQELQDITVIEIGS